MKIDINERRAVIHIPFLWFDENKFVMPADSRAQAVWAQTFYEYCAESFRLIKGLSGNDWYMDACAYVNAEGASEPCLRWVISRKGIRALRKWLSDMEFDEWLEVFTIMDRREFENVYKKHIRIAYWYMLEYAVFGFGKKTAGYEFNVKYAKALSTLTV